MREVTPARVRRSVADMPPNEFQKLPLLWRLLRRIRHQPKHDAAFFWQAFLWLVTGARPMAPFDTGNGVVFRFTRWQTFTSIWDVRRSLLNHALGNSWEASDVFNHVSAQIPDRGEVQEP